jgi:hypothetical protein
MNPSGYANIKLFQKEGFEDAAVIGETAAGPARVAVAG